MKKKKPEKDAFWLDMVSAVCAYFVVFLSICMAMVVIGDAIKAHFFDKPKVDAYTTEMRRTTEEKGPYSAEINPLNSSVLSKSGIDTETLESILPKSINNYAADFVKAEKITGVNALYLCAIAGLESGWNTSDIAQENNNMFGLTTDEQKYLHFDKPEDSIYYTANLLKVEYLNPYGKHYNGETIEDIGKSYCPEHPEWGAKVEIIKNQLNVKFNGDL